ncbi:hypothetical protein KC363_g1810 [Hortaea werneckii]|nr:hypothetical protein KC363_g1810 [Hortaea werneckii]
MSLRWTQALWVFEALRRTTALNQIKTLQRRVCELEAQLETVSRQKQHLPDVFDVLCPYPWDPIDRPDATFAERSPAVVDQSEGTSSAIDIDHALKLAADVPLGTGKIDDLFMPMPELEAGGFYAAGYDLFSTESRPQASWTQ